MFTLNRLLVTVGTAMAALFVSGCPALPFDQWGNFDWESSPSDTTGDTGENNSDTEHITVEWLEMSSIPAELAAEDTYAVVFDAAVVLENPDGQPWYELSMPGGVREVFDYRDGLLLFALWESEGYSDERLHFINVNMGQHFVLEGLAVSSAWFEQDGRYIVINTHDEQFTFYTPAEAQVVMTRVETH